MKFILFFHVEIFHEKIEIYSPNKFHVKKNTFFSLRRCAASWLFQRKLDRVECVRRPAELPGGEISIEELVDGGGWGHDSRKFTIEA